MIHPAPVARPPKGQEPGQLPTITITSPTDGSTVGSSFTATGTVSPGSEMVEAAVTDAHVPPQILATAGPVQGPNWSFTFNNLPAGPIRLHVKTTDNQASATISLTVQN
jgi:hypothetical protein